MIENAATLRLGVESKGVDTAKRKLKGLSKEGKIAEKQLDKTAKSSKRLGGSMIALVGGVGGLGLVVKRTVSEWLKFDKAMVEVATIAGVSTGRMKELRKEALKVATTLGVDATEAAQGFYQALSAGVNEADVGEFITTAAKFAQGGMTDVASATDLLTTAINSYKLESADAEAVGDKLFTTIKLGKTNAEQLARSFARAGSAAAQGGVELDELLGVTAAITKTGVPTAEAFTQIKASIAALYNPSSELRDIYEKLGVTSARQLIKQKGLAGALDAVRSATNGNEAQFIKALRSIEAYSGALVITGESLEAVRDLTGQVADGSGALDEAAAKVGDLLEIQTQKLKNQFIAVNEEIENQTGILAGASIVLASLNTSIQNQEGAIGKLVGGYIDWKTAAVNAGLEQEALSRAMNPKLLLLRGRQLQREKELMSDVTKVAEVYSDVLIRLSKTDITTSQDVLDDLNKRKMIQERRLALYSEEDQALGKMETKLNVLLDQMRRGLIDQNQWAEAVEDTKSEYEKTIRSIKNLDTAQKLAIQVAEDFKDLQVRKNDLRKEYNQLVLDSDDKILRNLRDQENKIQDMLDLNVGDEAFLLEKLRLLGLQVEARKQYNVEAAKTPDEKAFESVKKSLRTDYEVASDERKKRDEAIANAGSDIPEELKQELLVRSKTRFESDIEDNSNAPPQAIDLQDETNEQAKGLSLEFGSDDPYQGEIERLKAFEAEKLEIVSEATNLTESKRAEIKLNIQKDTERKIAAVEEAQFQERLALASDFFGNLSTVAKAFGEKGAKAAKAFAIVQATIDTYASAVAAYKAVVGIPVVGPALATAAAAGAIAAGLAQVAAIKAQKYQMGGIVGGSSYGGDQINAKLNSGEMVLNQTQQRNLFAQANNPIGGSRGGNVTIINNTRSEFDAETKNNNEGDMQIIVREAVDQAKIELTNEAQEGGGAFLPALETSYGLTRK